jgi:hypothetical protein
MATYGVIQKTVNDYLLFANAPTTDRGFESLDFDFLAPAGNEDVNINRLIVGDLVYQTGTGKIKKLKLNTTITLDTKIGVVVSISDVEGNTFNDVGDKTLALANGKLFTAIEGNVYVYFGNYYEFPLLAKSLYIHNENGASADLRVQFDWATHGAVGGFLSGKVKRIKWDSDAPTVILV